MSPSASPDVASTLLAHRHAFRAFLVSRVGSEADADDLLQHGLVKALQHADDLKDHEKAVPWFYQLLRRVIVDHVRSRAAARRRDDAWASDASLAPTPDDERALCRCFEPLIAELKPTHADLLRLVELEGKSVSAAAIALGLNSNQASVTLHRARAALRARLISHCGECSAGACLDCDCRE